MNFFALKDGVLHAENTPLTDIAAQYGTPCYVYSKQALTQAFHDFQQGLQTTDHLICFAVKANPNLAVLHLFAQ